MRITTPLGDDVLLLDGFEGSERMSSLFRFTASLLSEKPDIVAADLLRKGVTIEVTLDDGSARHFHGIVNRLSQGGRVEGLTSYRAEIVPMLWTLTLSQDCRIFQKMSVPEIVDAIFAQHGLSDVAERTTRSYPKRDYCVQYLESPFAFVSRLLEEEGIFYFFEHADGKHTLVLADAPSAIKPCPGQARARIVPEAGKALAEDVVLTWEKVHELRTGKVALTDYDPINPSLPLLASAAGKGPDEWFDYPGGYATVDEGARYTGLQLEEREAGIVTITGTGTVRAFTAGHKFDLREHYRRDDNGSYLLTSVQHIARAGDFRSWTTAPFDYQNAFSAMPAATPFRPATVTPKPRIRGTQPAVVTGPSGEEIYPDKYGRVKVHFFWDRHGKPDENSSCWIRVTTSWAGKGWGSIQIPRIGQEVMVGFLEGDPDQPIIVGSVYNAEQMPPHGLPGAMTSSGMKSNTHKGKGSNEMTMDDTAGKEKITVHAQYDMGTTVEHDDTQTVKNNRTITVDGTHTETVKKDTTITVSEGHYKHTVTAGNATHDVAAGTFTHHVAKLVTENFDNSQTTTVKVNVTIDGGDQIRLVSGDSSITLTKGGKITIHCKNLEVIGDTDIKASAPKVEVTGGDEAKFGVGNQQMTCDKAKVSVSGAAINASAVGTHEITGALVKIN
jgi:type VI secretion system secreted protein VgrG